MDRHGIERRSHSSKHHELNRPDLLKNWHQKHRLSLADIANLVGCEANSVRAMLDQHGIDIWTRGPEHPKLQNKNWLREQYNTQLRTAKDIADELDVSKDTVYKWVAKYNIEPGHPYPTLKNKEKLEQWYRDEELGTVKIAEQIGCSQGAVYNWLVEHGIETRSRTLSGPEHPEWCGGDPKYGLGWNENKREEVRNRDNRECRSCGLSETTHLNKYGCKLHVHHIQPARQFKDPEARNAKDNLLSLCVSCHARWEQMVPLRPDTRRVTGD